MADVDALIEQFWDTCDDDIEITVRVDQWWGVWVECPHGKFRGASVGNLDLSTAFQATLTRMREGHVPAEQSERVED